MTTGRNSATAAGRGTIACPFCKAERWEGDQSEVRGKGGPLFTSHMDRPPLCQIVIEAGEEIGLEYREDVNNLPPGAGDSIGWCQQTRGGRRRASTARTYLRPALKRPNLQLVTNAMVHRVLFEGQRAVGVEFSRGGGTERAKASREVILSAGAVGSPHLLQISGVGDPEHLGRVGVPVIHELRGVGKNMQDHYVCRMTYPIHGARTANERARGLPLAAEIVRYLVDRQRHADLQRLTGRGLGQGAGGIGNCRPQCSFAPGSFKDGQIGQLEEEPGLTGGSWQMRPLSRGYVDAKSPDPQVAPAINPRYLSEEADRRAVIGGLRFLRRIFAAPALARYVGAEKLPGAQVQSDDELLDYGRRNGNTVYHASCTCMMGPVLRI